MHTRATLSNDIMLTVTGHFPLQKIALENKATGPLVFQSRLIRWKLLQARVARHYTNVFTDNLQHHCCSGRGNSDTVRRWVNRRMHTCRILSVARSIIPQLNWHPEHRLGVKTQDRVKTVLVSGSSICLNHMRPVPMRQGSTIWSNNIHCDISGGQKRGL